MAGRAGILARMVRALATTSLLVALALSAPAHAKKRPHVTCHSGTAIITQGTLRVFGIPFTSPAEGVFRGDDVYACLPGGPPRLLGQVGADQGTDSETIDGLVFDGSEYLARQSTDDGEGGPTVTYGVTDLRTGRDGAFANGEGGLDEVPPFRVLSDGRLLTSDDGVRLVAANAENGSGRLISTRRSDEVAVSGATAYWSEQPDDGPVLVMTRTFAARSSAPENVVLSPIDGLPNRSSRCERRTGATIARSQQVRVLASGTNTFACRDDHRGVIRLAPEHGAADIRIFGTRWLVVALGDPVRSVTVYDMQHLTTATTVKAPTQPVSSWTLAGDGTLAWIQGGAVFAQGPDAGTPTTLARTTNELTALASANHTIYWTENDEAHRFATG